jgi:hypothetical protein
MENLILKKGTKKCPDDKTILHFECFQGMVLARMDDETKLLVLSAKCPHCGKYFKVKSE